MKKVKTNGTGFVRMATARNAVGGGDLPSQVDASLLVTAKPKTLADYIKAAKGNIKAHLGWMFGALDVDRDGNLLVMLDTRDPAKAEQCCKRIKTALDPLGVQDFKVSVVKVDGQDGGAFYDCKVDYNAPLDKAITAALKAVPVVAGKTSDAYAIVLEYTDGDELLIGSGCVKLTKQYAKFGVSAHVLPGMESPNGSPLFMVVGVTEGAVRKALDAITPGDANLYYSSIKKLPV